MTVTNINMKGQYFYLDSRIAKLCDGEMIFSIIFLLSELYLLVGNWWVYPSHVLMFLNNLLKHQLSFRLHQERTKIELFANKITDLYNIFRIISLL